ncbi:MAG: fimbrillin family protein, partial [Bacteroidales bacterium]
MSHFLIKYILLALTTALYYSCSNDDLDISRIENKPSDDLKNNKEQINFSAAASKSITTYTELQNDYSVIWEGKDKYPNSPDEIGLFTDGLLSDVSNLKLWALNSGKTSMLDFDGELKWGDVGQTFYAYSPYSAGNSINSVSGNLPNKYLQLKDGEINHIKHIDFLYAKQYLPQIPLSKRVNLEFNHLFSIVELSVSGSFDELTADNYNLFFGKFLTRIDVRLVNQESGETLPIAGDYTADLNSIQTLSNGTITPPKIKWSNPKDVISIYL